MDLEMFRNPKYIVVLNSIGTQYPTKDNTFCLNVGVDNREFIQVVIENRTVGN